MYEVYGDVGMVYKILYRRVYRLGFFLSLSLSTTVEGFVSVCALFPDGNDGDGFDGEADQ